MKLPTPKTIAERLHFLYLNTGSTSLRLTKSQFNALAGRRKIEESIVLLTVRALRRDSKRRAKLELVRLGPVFAVLDRKALSRLSRATQPNVRKAIKSYPGATA